MKGGSCYVAAPLPPAACRIESYFEWITVSSLLFRRVLWPEVVGLSMGLYCLSPAWGRTRDSVTGCRTTSFYTSFDYFG